jgi:predicted Ser/Thr protein kinase
MVEGTPRAEDERMNSESLIGKTIGNYRIISRLGRGGMATVYRARQVTMGRDVAIKVMSADLAEDPQYEARFEREAQVIANLQHPRVLPVHDFGHEGEVFYLVMRVIEGESLYQRLMRGKLKLDRAARYVNQIAEALDYAHSQGVIHRDLKPNNVLIDELDNLYLMDFGLAKMLAATHSLTQTGTVIGTPQYMAPEQWRGEPVDARTDVYSLGVILYEMVVGRPPFESDTPFTLMYKHVNDPPPAPRDALPDLPPPVETVIMQALAKDPAERFESAGALARDLTSCVRAANVPGAGALMPPPEVPLPDPSTAQEAPVQGADSPPVVTAGLAVGTSEAVDDAADGTLTGAADSGVDAAPARESAQDAAAAAEPPPDAQEVTGADDSGDVPMPEQIIPPPPPIPVAPKDEASVPRSAPHSAPASSSGPAITGAPDSPPRKRRKHPPHSRGGTPPGSAVRRALDVVDHGLESALEKAAQAAPPLSGPASDAKRKPEAGVQYSPQGLPSNAPAQYMIAGLLGRDEDLLGVLDVRGTGQWSMWKNTLIGGLVLNLLGGILSVGLFHMLGWVAWIFLAVQVFRTWRGDIGRYYLGFTSDRVILLPRDAESAPQYGDALAAGWPHIDRLRLTGRYVLLDMPDGSDDMTSFAALLVSEGEGGLGDQQRWLPYSPIGGQIADQGFEVDGVE